MTSNQLDQDETSFNGQKIVRHLAAAEGYLELNMPGYALAELGRVTQPGPFEPIAQLFRGEALQAQEKYAEAIEPLNVAAKLFPMPFSRRAFMALSNCYRHEGNDQLADQALEAAEFESQNGGPTTLQLAVMPIFQVQSGSNGRINRSST